MKTSEISTGRFLKKDDFPKPALLTVREVKKIDVAAPGEATKERGVMYFQEREKGLVLNTTNRNRAEKIFGDDEMDRWVGQPIVCYTDDTVEFGGKLIGGLRLRAPSKRAAVAPAAAVSPFDEFDDDVAI
jgi:hypothetical protein